MAAYRDRYNITDPAPLGAPAEGTAQKIDAARARTALNRVQKLCYVGGKMLELGGRTVSKRGGRAL